MKDEEGSWALREYCRLHSNDSTVLLRLCFLSYEVVELSICPEQTMPESETHHVLTLIGQWPSLR